MLAYEREGGAIIGVVVTHCAAKLPILRAMAGRSPHHAMRGKNLEDESAEAQVATRILATVVSCHQEELRL